MPRLTRTNRRVRSNTVNSISCYEFIERRVLADGERRFVELPTDWVAGSVVKVLLINEPSEPIEYTTTDSIRTNEIPIEVESSDACAPCDVEDISERPF